MTSHDVITSHYMSSNHMTSYDVTYTTPDDALESNPHGSLLTPKEHIEVEVYHIYKYIHDFFI